MSRQFTKEFKEDAVRYYLEHKDLGITLCAKNLGTSRTALFTWIKNAQANNGEVPTRDSGNLESDLGAASKNDVVGGLFRVSLDTASNMPL